MCGCRGANDDALNTIELKRIVHSAIRRQVATGKDRDALKFDWRRIARKAEGLLDGKGPFVTPWVEANRLLSGPYDSATKAREMMNQLKALGVDSFIFTSAEGEAVEKL